MAEVDSRKRSVKKRWDTFKKRNPKIAATLKHGTDILTGGAISKYEIKKIIKDKKKRDRAKEII